MKAKFINEEFILKPKSEDEIIKNLSKISQNELNDKLMYASHSGQTSIVKMLLDAGADVNVNDSDNSTPLMCASRKGHIDVVKLLLLYGADVNVRNDYGKTSLLYAKNTEIAELLIKYKTKINESLGDILKPKNSIQIVESLTPNILIDLLNGEAIGFFKSFSKASYNVYKSTYSVKQSFEKYSEYKQYDKIVYGSGLYVMTNVFVPNPEEYPLKHIFSNMDIGDIGTTATKIFKVNESQLDLAVKELLSATINNTFGNGFHMMYVKPTNVIQESLFKPKSEQTILDDIYNQITYEYKSKSIGIDHNFAKRIKIMTINGNSFFDIKYPKYGEGLYIAVSDDDILELKRYLTKNNYYNSIQFIGNSTFIVNDPIQEETIIKHLIRFTVDHKIDWFRLKKFNI